MLLKANPDQRVVIGRSFDYDASQGASMFADPDGDPLRYEITVTTLSTKGLTLNGSRITGTPTELGGVAVDVRVHDPQGATEHDEFVIFVVENSAPVASPPIPDHLTTVGGFVDLDVRGTFSDRDGDPFTYALSFSYAEHGLSITGSRITGIFDKIGAAVVKVTATDREGAVGEDTFTIAAPAPDPGRPTPQYYDYADLQVPLPAIYQLSRFTGPNLWDTTRRSDNAPTNFGGNLGRVLFYDKRLSITNTHSCASCHEQSRGFSSPQGIGVQGLPTRRNPMALANVRFNILDRFFSDQRVETLEALILLPIQDPLELGNSLEIVEQRLAATDFYPPLFTAAFGTPEITSDRIARAIGQFLRSMISYRSKFDTAMHSMDYFQPTDPATVFTAQEMRGMQLFEIGRCDFCHQRNSHNAERPSNNGIDVDPVDVGAGRGVFRAASLRNVVLTAPYMHDGRFKTLREVIDHYDHGVKQSPLLDDMLIDDFVTRTPRRLNLTEADKVALETFLLTLTDYGFLTDPKFSDPFQ